MLPDAVQQTEQFWLSEVPGWTGGGGLDRGTDQRVGRREGEGRVVACSSPLGQTVLGYSVNVVLSPVVRLHLGLQVLGVLGEDGQPQVVRAQPGQDGHDEVGPVLGHQPVPGQDVLRLVGAEGVAELLRHRDGLLPLLHLEPLLRQHRQLLVVTLAGQVLLQHVDVLEDILKVVILIFSFITILC